MKEKNIDKEIIGKYLAGDCNAEEQYYVEKLFLDGEENSGLKQYVSEDWNKYIKDDTSPGKNIDPILDRIHHTIHLKDSLKKKNAGRKIYFWYSSVAAAVLLPLLVLSFYLVYQSGKNTGAAQENPVVSQIHAPTMSRVQFSLPDGTTGWLNSNSTLEYSVPFSNNRKIKLTGEVYLDVAHDESHPFSIDVKDASVKVLGTRLNVNGYPDENYLEVVLEEGKIEFTSKNGSERTVMQPGEKITYKNGEIEGYTKTDPEKYTSWKEGKLVFRGDPMEEVARRIERWYNVKVVLEDEVLKTYSFRATFEDDPLSELLRLLSMTSPIDYEILERKPQTDGSFNKTTIILSKRKI